MANKSKRKRDNDIQIIGAVVVSGISTLIVAIVAFIGLAYVDDLALESIGLYLTLTGVVVGFIAMVIGIISLIDAYRTNFREKKEKQILEEYSEFLEQIDSDLEATEEELFYSDPAV